MICMQGLPETLNSVHEFPGAVSRPKILNRSYSPTGLNTFSGTRVVQFSLGAVVLGFERIHLTLAIDAPLERRITGPAAPELVPKAGSVDDVPRVSVLRL